jgi:hypothetical protein
MDFIVEEDGEELLDGGELPTDIIIVKNKIFHNKDIMQRMVIFVVL